MGRKAAAGLAVCAALLALGGTAQAQAQSTTPVLALSFDEGQGAAANDASPADNDGAITGARWTSAGRFGKALSFDGDDLVQVADAPSLHLGALTMEAWVRPRSAGRWQTAMLKPDAAWGPAFYLYTAWPDNRQGPNAGVTYSAVTGPDPLPLNTWSHLAATFDGTTWRLYVDAVQVDAAPGPAPGASDQPLTIGGSHLYPDEGFDGLIDEVRVFAGARTAAQIATDRATRVGSGANDTVRPVLAMGFEGGAGSTVADASAYGNTGVIRGARWTTSGKFGKALMFDGLDDWVTVADSASLDLRDELTLSAWVKPRIARPFEPVIVKEQSGNWTYQLYAYSASAQSGPHASLAKGALPSAGYWGTAGPTAVPTGAWSHVATTWDGTVMKVYVNGTLVSSANGGLPPLGDGPLRIGGNAIVPGELFDGVIDEVRVYDKALDVTQVRRDRDTRVGG